MSKPKVLVVEDEAIVAEDIASRLNNMGYLVTDIVASGEDAINSVSVRVPNLVLMDIMLQGKINGIEAAKQIFKKIKSPIIYLTAYGDESTLQKANFSGAYGYLIKPFHQRELRATLEIVWSRYKSEIEVQKALQEAQKQNELRAEYFSQVSHEFRNPLSHIQAWAQLLQRYGKNWDEQRKQESLQKIETAAVQMNQLLDDLLILSHSEIEQDLLNLVSFNLMSFCEQMIQNHQFIAGKQYQLKLICQGNCQQVAFDQKLLAHLLNNLISNAIKYSPKGGEITLRVMCEETTVSFQVTDHGIGIPQNDLPQLFTPFQRASNVGTIQGTGLGLVIVKRFVDLHQGKIDINSQEGQGTSITVTLPRKHLRH